jgi:hypothetical protein
MFITAFHVCIRFLFILVRRKFTYFQVKIFKLRGVIQTSPKNMNALGFGVKNVKTNIAGTSSVY